MTQRPKIRDYMTTDLISLSPEMEVVHAMSLLLKNKISGAPVVDPQGQLVGVLSKKDCLKAALNASYYQELGGAVRDYMTGTVETLDEELDIVEAAERFLDSHYRRFPVLREGGLVGQVSRADILRALVENWR
ncbi:CBS domain-containing protein [Nitratireductor mangrovi]|uniref:CBS domain-containing protein n=1 Tax=Nitratireductor mangrovi TaxID=2599600 RepID=A0A5B8L0T2_9HYPH|nr:CBS domain-containing protein [Nitratireductor mangrovi]QDZ01545.1 CBS domain-containing protein [Nitratireductor mangrovi]